MSDLQKELSDLRSYVSYLKQDRDAQKAKENSERWTRWVSLTIVFLAVAAALANQQYGGFSGRAVRSLNHAAIAQGNATNQWSYFQAVSIKLHMYEFEQRRDKTGALAKPPKAELLAPNVAGAGAAPAEGSPAKPPQGKKDKGEKTVVGKDGKKKKPKTVAGQIEKYREQKPKIEAKARAFEVEVNVHRKDSEDAQKHTKELTLALAVLQVSIAVGSIAALAKKKPLWFVSMLIGAYGVFATFNGIFLWFA